MALRTDFFSRIPGDDSNSDSPEKCRKRRRRRIEMRRMRISSGRLSSPQFQQLSSPREMQDTLPDQQPHSVAADMVEHTMPDFGFLSIKGLNESMDDAVFVKQEFCLPDIVGGSPLHFFAVYDGHGGSHVYSLCKELMHKIMEEELTSLHISKTTATGDGSCSLSLVLADLNKQETEELEAEEELWEDLIRVGIEKSFQRMDEVSPSTCGCGRTGFMCGWPPMEQAFAGSRAVVALISRDHIVVASSGNSRGVLCRHGRAIPLSLDHKPEISITGREAQDECLILGSDGLWDVLSDDLACKLASSCLRDGSPTTAAPPPPPPPRRSRHSGRRIRPIKDEGGAQGLMFPSKSKLAADIHCRLALARGSHDNISVIVVNLLSSGN